LHRFRCVSTLKSHDCGAVPWPLAMKQGPAVCMRVRGVVVAVLMVYSRVVFSDPRIQSIHLVVRYRSLALCSLDSTASPQSQRFVSAALMLCRSSLFRIDQPMNKCLLRWKSCRGHNQLNTTELQRWLQEWLATIHDKHCKTKQKPHTRCRVPNSQLQAISHHLRQFIARKLKVKCRGPSTDDTVSNNRAQA
jgi:hypothetical protein